MTHSEPTHRVRADWALDLPIIDLRDMSQIDRDRELQTLISQEVRRPFDLSGDLMVRAVLVCVEQLEYVLLLTMHHIASDTFSRDILFEEIDAFYEEFTGGKRASLPELPIQYADYAVWQREQTDGDVLKTQLSYWKKQLAEIVPVLQLPFDHPRRPVQNHAGTKHSFRLPRALSEGLKTLSREQGVTLFMTLLAAFQTLLHRYSADDNIAVGSPSTGRNRIETEGLIGFFANTLVFRTNFSGNPGFLELLQRVRSMALEAYANRDVPFEKVVEELRPERDLAHNPLFQVAFIMQSTSRPDLKLANLDVTPLRIDTNTSKFDLTLIVSDTANPERELEVFFEYDTDLFERDTILRMSGHFETLLENIVADPTSQISALPLLTAAEEWQLIEEWNRTQAGHSVAVCTHHLFEAQVRRTPTKIAVAFSEHELTYDELNRRSNQLAHRLRKVGVGPNKIVAVCLEPSLEMLVAFLGVLKAGGGYLPLDLSSPEERIQVMLSDADALALLTTENVGKTLPKDSPRRIYLDRDWSAINLESDEDCDLHPDPEDTAYVLYTSGSTGKPKGVEIPHRALTNFLQWIQHEFPLDAGDRVLQRTRCSFDISAYEFYAPLLTGARLVITPAEATVLPSALVQLIQDQEITVLQVVPSVLNLLLNEEGFENCRSLRQVFCGGEALPVELHNRFFNVLSCRLTNLYGPTETCIWSTFYRPEISDDGTRRIGDGIVPIGRPIANTQVYVLDQAGHPVPIGIPGELYIAGAGVAKGYLNLSELTADRFPRNPFSSKFCGRVYRTGDIVRYDATGLLHFLGRTDHQIKMRGLRIELQEIESVLRQNPDVEEAIVVLREDAPGDQHLVAYIVQSKGMHCSISELRSFLLRSCRST